MVLFAASLDSVRYMIKCPSDSGLVNSWNNFLACLKLLSSCPAWECLEELEWMLSVTDTPWHTLTSVVFNFEFADCFLVVAELHFKPLRSTFLHIYVTCDIGLVFLVIFYRISKNCKRKSPHIWTKGCFKKPLQLQWHRVYLEMGLDQGTNPVAKHFQNFIVPCDFLICFPLPFKLKRG